jgi:hypothetical protein
MNMEEPLSLGNGTVYFDVDGRLYVGDQPLAPGRYAIGGGTAVLEVYPDDDDGSEL